MKFTNKEMKRLFGEKLDGMQTNGYTSKDLRDVLNIIGDLISESIEQYEEIYNYVYIHYRNCSFFDGLDSYLLNHPDIKKKHALEFRAAEQAKRNSLIKEPQDPPNKNHRNRRKRNNLKNKLRNMSPTVMDDFRAYYSFLADKGCNINILSGTTWSNDETKYTFKNSEIGFVLTQRIYAQFKYTVTGSIIHFVYRGTKPQQECSYEITIKGNKLLMKSVDGGADLVLIRQYPLDN